MRKALLVFAMSAASMLAIDTEILRVKFVYIMRMGGGLDQFLASELAKNGLYTVTTDAQKADALFTESLGEGFEKKYIELYPPPAPPEAEEKEAEEKKKDDVSLTQSPMQRVGNSSWGRGKGTVFLVDRKTRSLLWSTNRQTKSTGASEMVTQARKVVEQLKKDLELLTPKP